MALILVGKIVPLDQGDPEAFFEGKLFLSDDGFIDGVTPNLAETLPGYSNAPEVKVDDSLIIPGLIDLHNHLGYNTLPLWTEPKKTVPFAHHNSWTVAPSYKSKISWPATALATAEPEALLAYVQVRALAGGVTAIQGWPSANRSHFQLLRNIDTEKAGTRTNLILTSTLTKSNDELARVAQLMNNQGVGFIYHCSEGQVGSVVGNEFINTAHAGCLQPTFIGIHCNAVAATDWKQWPKEQAGAIVWSPFSNLWLYGSTTNISAAREQGITICLGSDWGPSGTKNLLGEVKIAKLVSEKQGLGLTDFDLVAIVTCNPGDVLKRCWSRQIGRLMKGAFADVLVLKPRSQGSIWSQIVSATENDVALIVTAGQPRYGDKVLLKAAGAKGVSDLTASRLKKSVVIPDPNDLTATWTWKTAVTKLKAVIKDPVTAINNAKKKMDAFAGRVDSADAPLELILDMPLGDAPMAGTLPPDLKDVHIPQLPSLMHDEDFFTAIQNNSFHNGLLNRLSEYYK